jgi:hypothetical protein
MRVLVVDGDGPLGELMSRFLDGHGILPMPFERSELERAVGASEEAAQ